MKINLIAKIILILGFIVFGWFFYQKIGQTLIARPPIKAR